MTQLNGESLDNEEEKNSIFRIQVISVIEAKSVKLEDGIEYMVIDEIVNANTTYYYLANIDDEEDFCVRKINKDKNDQLLVGLDSVG